MFCELTIGPSFHHSATITLDTAHAGIMLTVIYYDTAAKASKTITAPVGDASLAEELNLLTHNIIAASRPDNRFILDGVDVCCTTLKNGKKTSYEFRCPEKGTEELRLVHGYFKLLNSLFKDTGVVNCFEMLEVYFEGFIPIKTFEEQVFRIRLYGSITTWEKQALEQAVQLAAGRAAVRMDLSNLENMGTVLYPCFSPLLQVSDVTWQVKEPFVQYLEGVGFSKSQMEILPV